VAAKADVPTVDVVCGVIWSPAGDRYLLAERPKGRIWNGYWEFPGGKIEPGEAPADAMARELHEELGIRVSRADPWLLKVFEYPHARVRLHFFHVRQWSGTPAGLEGQRLCWQAPGTACGVGPLLPANAPILRALDMPALLPVTPPPEVGHQDALARVDAGLGRLAFGGAERWLQVRRGRLTPAEWRDWADLASQHGVLPIANTSAADGLTLGAEAIHLSAARLMALAARPPAILVGASVHDRAEIAHAAALGLDYVILGSVNATSTHPGREGLGWTAWSDIARWSALPVFAIGGLQAQDLEQARRHGASGIAMIGGAWGR